MTYGLASASYQVVAIARSYGNHQVLWGLHGPLAGEVQQCIGVRL